MSQPVQASNRNLQPGEPLGHVSKRITFSMPEESPFARFNRAPQVRVDPQFFREVGELWFTARTKSLAKAVSAEEVTRREAHPSSSSSNQLVRASSSSPKRPDRGASSPDAPLPHAEAHPHTAHTRQLSQSISLPLSVSADEQLSKLEVTLEQSQRLVISYENQLLGMSEALKREGADRNLRDIITLEQSRQSALKEKRGILGDSNLSKYYYAFQWHLDSVLGSSPRGKGAHFLQDRAERENIAELLGRQLALTQVQKINVPNFSPEKLAVEQGDLLLSLIMQGVLHANLRWEDVPALAKLVTKTEQSNCTLYPLPSAVSSGLQRRPPAQGEPRERLEGKRGV